MPPPNLFREVYPLARPCVSVLLPVRDAAPFLSRCLRGLLGQSLRDLEILAVNDHSSDGSRSLLEEAARSDPRVRVFDAEEEGIVPALEMARAHAQAEIIARCDADDAIHPHRLAAQYELLQSLGECGVASCRVCVFPRPDLREGIVAYTAWLNEAIDHQTICREIFVENPLPHPTLMLTRRLLDEVGGWRDPTWPEDYDLTLRLHRAGAHFAKVPQVRYALRQHEARLTWVDPRYSRASFLACKAHYLAQGPLCDREFVVWGAGPTGKYLARALETYSLRPQRFVDIDPAKIGKTRRGLDVAGPESVLGRRELILGALSSRGARQILRERLLGYGLLEGRDFLMVA